MGFEGSFHASIERVAAEGQFIGIQCAFKTLTPPVDWFTILSVLLYVTQLIVDPSLVYSNITRLSVMLKDR